MTHTLQAIAWTLVHFVWQAGAVAMLYVVVARLTARRSSHVRYGVALAALLAMTFMSLLTFAFEVTEDGEQSIATISAYNSTSDLPRVAAPGRIPASEPILTQASQKANAMAERLPSYVFWIDLLWLAGVCGLSLRNLGGWWLIHQLRSRAAHLQPSAELCARFSGIAARLHVGTPVLLRLSDAIAGPVTVGAFRSIVLLPLSAVSGLGIQELEVVLAHELAHVRRADYLWNLIQSLVETVFFFHPAVWWISGRIRHERELCCDDLALEACPDPVTYASALFHLEEQRSRHLHLAMALDGHQSRQTLRMRIARILGEKVTFSSRSEHRPFSIVPVLTGVVILALSAPQVLATLRPSQPAKVAAAVHVAAPEQQSTPAPPPQSAPQKPAAARRQAPASDESQTSTSSNAGTPHKSYIDEMKAAGYGDDLDKLIAMKIQNVTPEYARSMAQAGFGKPSADELIACKIHGISPEALQQFKQQGLEVKSLQDAISFKIFQVTPEFTAQMKAAGFTNLDSKKLVALRVQNVTPEYARSITQQFPGATVDDVMQTKIFHIDAGFIASARSHGFNNLTLQKLVQLRISGLLDDQEK
jgi:beta-lactamase regulating signal transducer with metallopeptidase domain